MRVDVFRCSWEGFTKIPTAKVHGIGDENFSTSWHCFSSINQSINQSINRSTDQPIYQSINQSVDRLMDQGRKIHLISQSTNQPWETILNQRYEALPIRIPTCDHSQHTSRLILASLNLRISHEQNAQNVSIFQGHIDVHVKVRVKRLQDASRRPCPRQERVAERFQIKPHAKIYKSGYLAPFGDPFPGGNSTHHRRPGNFPYRIRTPLLILHSLPRTCTVFVHTPEKWRATILGATSESKFQQNKMANAERSSQGKSAQLSFLL